MSRNGLSRRARGVPRSRTVAAKHLTKAVLGETWEPPSDVVRPKTRGDCRDGMRPCPFVGCRFSLYLDVNPETGSIKFVFPTIEPWEMTESCALDVADRGGLTLEEIGLITNLTRERVRQVEATGLVHMKFRAAIAGGDE